MLAAVLVRPLSGYGRGRRLVPFAGGLLAGLWLVVLDGAQSGRVFGERLAAVGVAAVVTLAVAVVPWRRLPAWLEALPGFGVLAVVCLAVAGTGAHSVYAPLVLLPLLWFAVYARPRTLLLAVAAADGFVLAETALGSIPVSRHDLRAGLIWAGVVAAVPWALHRFVTDLQRRAALAERDYVTDLLSRRGWEERLPQELARARENHTPLSIVLLDLNHFKHYNDLHGHQAGDALLRQVAIAWNDQLRSTDTLARFGGDEYAAALPGCTAHDAHTTITNLLAHTPTPISASAGIAQWQPGETLDQLTARADKALYTAKTQPRRNCITATAEEPLGPPRETNTRTPTTPGRQPPRQHEAPDHPDGTNVLEGVRFSV
jgi:diguanylate cyclase (GGDEF)-like protein